MRGPSMNEQLKLPSFELTKRTPGGFPRPLLALSALWAVLSILCASGCSCRCHSVSTDYGDVIRLSGDRTLLVCNGKLFADMFGPNWSNKRIFFRSGGWYCNQPARQHWIDGDMTPLAVGSPIVLDLESELARERHAVEVFYFYSAIDKTLFTVEISENGARVVIKSKNSMAGRTDVMLPSGLLKWP